MGRHCKCSTVIPLPGAQVFKRMARPPAGHLNSRGSLTEEFSSLGELIQRSHAAEQDPTASNWPVSFSEPRSPAGGMRPYANRQEAIHRGSNACNPDAACCPAYCACASGRPFAHPRTVSTLPRLSTAPHVASVNTFSVCTALCVLMIEAGKHSVYFSRYCL